MIAALPYLLIAMIFYGMGEYYSKIYANTNAIKFAILAWTGYAINAAMFFPAIKAYNSLSILGTMWNLTYVILTLILGVFVFQESISTTQQVGICFAIIAIVLLSLSTTPTLKG